MSNTSDLCYTTDREIEWLARLKKVNRPAFETQCRIILNGQRRYGPGVSLLTLKTFIRLEGELHDATVRPM